jgi:uncharacterized membrane protein
MTEKREKLILWAGVAAFVAIVFTISVFKYFRFGFNGFDLAIYNQAFWNTIHGHWFATSINPPSYLGDHAEWLILALAPFYALIPHPLTLVFLNIAVVAVSAVPVWLIAKTKFSDAKTRLLFPLLWLINPYVWNLAFFEFHLITFAVPLTLFAAYFFLKDRWGAFMIMVLALLLCREDMSFIVIGFAFLAIFETIRGRKQPRELWRWAALPIILAVAAFTVDQIAITHFNPDGTYKFFVYYDWLGRTPLAILSAMLANPLRVFLHFFKPVNLYLAIVLLLPVVLLPILRPRFLLIILIITAEYMLSRDGAELVIIKSQYAAAFLPAIMLATIEGYEQFMKTKKPFKFIPKDLVPAIIVVASIYVWFTYGPGVGLAKGLARPNAREQAMQAAISLIPKDAPVVASVNTLTELSSRKYVWPMSYFWIGKKQYGTSDYILPLMPDYLVLDEQDFIYFTMVYPQYSWSVDAYPLASKKFRTFIESGKYGVIFNRQGIAVLKRGAGGALPFVAVQETMPEIKNPLDKKMGPLNFLGWDPSDGGAETHLFFSTDASIADELVLKVNGEYQPLGNGLYPTADWKPKEVIEVTVPAAAAKMQIQLAAILGGLNVASDGSLFFSFDKEKNIGEKIILPSN